jgi:hypothetical protein
MKYAFYKLLIVLLLKRGEEMILGMELQVSLTSWIVSQILAFAVLVLTVWAFSVKAKNKTLAISTICSLICIPMNILLGNWIMMYFSIFFVLRNGIFYILEIGGKRVSFSASLSIFIVFSLAAIIMVTLVWSHWFDWILLTGTLATGFGKWLRGKRGVHGMRITKVYKCALSIVNATMYMNFINVIKHLVIIASVAVFYLRLLKERKTTSINTDQATI